MSKLYEQYKKLKGEDKDTVYIFKSGIFYISLDEDAKKLSEIFNFKLTPFNDTIVKCGFPQTRLAYYMQALNQNKVSFQIVDSNYSKIDNYSDYINNVNLKKVVQFVLDIDMNNTTFQDAFFLLQKIQNSLKDIQL